MQIQFNNQLGKYTLYYTEPQKSLEIAFSHVFVCIYQWSAPYTFAKATVHFR